MPNDLNWHEPWHCHLWQQGKDPIRYSDPRYLKKQKVARSFTLGGSPIYREG